MSPQVNQPIVNLDIRCAEAGRELADIKGMEEKVLNNALAVLEEQGPYAMFLYITARHNEVAPNFQDHCVSLLKDVFTDKIRDDTEALKASEQLAQNLDDLLFARELLRSALVYAQYHLKARGSGS